MAAPEGKSISLAAQWMVRAREDLLGADRSLKYPMDANPAHAAFFSQQSAEKNLKAWLEYRQVTFPYTHDIDRLAGLAAGCGLDTSCLSDAGRLTQYAVTARYPGIDRPIMMEEAKGAMLIARRVEQSVHDALRAAGFPNEMIPK
jgi:HEPN domain-containing protein